MKLHTWLTKHGKTAAWLAEEAGLSRSYVSRLIASDGDRTPSLETCVKIAKATDGEVTVLDFMPEQPGPPGQKQEKVMRPSTREVSRAA